MRKSNYHVNCGRMYKGIPINRMDIKPPDKSKLVNVVYIDEPWTVLYLSPISQNQRKHIANAEVNVIGDAYEPDFCVICGEAHHVAECQRFFVLSKHERTRH